MSKSILRVSCALSGPARLIVGAWIVLSASTTLAAADIVTDWNVIVDTVAVRFGAPQQQARVQAMAQIAVHDALNTIVPRYERHTYFGPTRRGAAPDAAVAAAARHTLLALLAPLPDSAQKQEAMATIENAYASTVGPGPFARHVQKGIDVGEAAAAAILEARTGDGSDMPHRPYTLLPGPGVYQPTPAPEFPAAVVPLFAGWAHVTPFALHHNVQFEVDPAEIFDLGGSAYAAEYNEVKRIGDARIRGELPDSEESDVARFWPGGGSNWGLTARTIVSNKGLDRWELARLFALLNVAQADALIVNQNWKYIFNFWRPVTAIRWPDDGNPTTDSDPAWRPFLVTPPYPDYPCALPSATAAAAAVLRQHFGTDGIAFTRSFTAPAVPLPAPMAALPAKTITRAYDSLSAAVKESIDARVFAGIHFREGCRAGARQGTKVGRFVARHSLEPLKRR